MTTDQFLEGSLPPSEHGVSRASRLRILVVEDHADTAATMAELLRLLGHEVFVAGSGVEALPYAEKNSPDAVLLDIGLPGMSGWEIAQRIQAFPGGRRPLLVAITGYGQEADRERSRAAGIHFHLVKPVDPEELEQLLRRFHAILPRSPGPGNETGAS
jgi:CheY-like chemotaxis protein